MVNSNENTQNPKDDQERMADEGIQDHSEHTAENKQPESKDDVQNTDESTCLCKFFKKIAEWMCPRKIKTQKKADENAAENNDAAKQEEMKQVDTVEQPKKQIKLSDYLEIISKLLGILTILGTISGGFFIYKYLENIGQLSIFPEMITNPSVFIATTITFGSIFLLFLTLFSIFYFIGVKLYNASPSSKLIIKFIILIIEFFVLILNFCLLYLYINNNYDHYKILFISILSFIINSSIISLFLGLKNNQNKEKKKYYYFLYTCVYYILIFVILLFFQYYKTLIFESIHFIRFAETPDNSSWYLLHNNFQQNNGFQETNGINKSDLKKLKKYFTKPKQCSKLDPRENALYGYMAWNLGDTKVFCPSYQTNLMDDVDRQPTDYCIIISGKNLQIMPERYISTEPIQQPKYDVKEPTIEIK